MPIFEIELPEAKMEADFFGGRTTIQVDAETLLQAQLYIVKRFGVSVDKQKVVGE